jgi:hypothetical protein
MPDRVDVVAFERLVLSLSGAHGAVLSKRFRYKLARELVAIASNCWDVHYCTKSKQNTVANANLGSGTTIVTMLIAVRRRPSTLRS